MARHDFKRLREAMTPRQRRESALRAKRMMAGMLLAEIRREAGLSQEALARAMGIKQPSLSKLESQSDMQISTLRHLVQALGGKLEIVAHLPQGDVRICQFDEPVPA